MEPFKTFIKSFGHAQGIPLAFSDAARVPEEEPSMQVNQELPDMYFICFSLGGSKCRVIKSLYMPNSWWKLLYNY